MRRLLFCCSQTGQEFDSGFKATAAEVTEIPLAAVVRIKCRVCQNLHEFRFRQARLAEEPNG